MGSRSPMPSPYPHMGVPFAVQSPLAAWHLRRISSA